MINFIRSLWKHHHNEIKGTSPLFLKKSAGKKGKNEIKEGVKIQFWIQIEASLIGLLGVK